MQGLVERMLRGQIKVLFVHGVDLVAALPGLLWLAARPESPGAALLIRSLPDETSRLAD